MKVTKQKFQGLYYQLYQNSLASDCPPLVIIGGLGDQTRNWETLAKKFALHFNVLIFDNRSAGQSHAPLNSYSLAEMAHETKNLIVDVFANQNINLLGFSMGGKIALYLALNFPQVLNRLLLTSTAFSWQAPFNPTAVHLAVLKNPAQTPEHFAKQFQILFSPKYQNQNKPDLFVKYKLRNPFPQSEFNYLQQLKAIENSLLTEMDLEKIKIPVMVLAGQNDPLVSPLALAVMQAKLGASVKIYEECGHVLPVEQPQSFYQDVVSFFNPRGVGVSKICSFVAE